MCHSGQKYGDMAEADRLCDLSKRRGRRAQIEKVSESTASLTTRKGKNTENHTLGYFIFHSAKSMDDEIGRG